MNLSWNPEKTSEKLNALLRALSEEYPVSEVQIGENLNFKWVDGSNHLKVRKNNSSFEITCGSVAAASRGTAYALSGQEANEVMEFERFGILLDCSRAPVITVEHMKKWLRRLSLMGYNIAMIYTKDTYQLEGENYFGYMRGAYSIDEIRQMDAYAALLGIELIASIQALGHLEPIIRWPAYHDIADTANVVLVDNEKTYILLEKMIKFWSDALGSRRIHLGMDETHDLGRGRFMDLNGYERPFDIYNRHLKRVCDICDIMNLKPMIWSDMYFRLGNKKLDYYDPETVIPDDVRNAIDKRTQLVYWDYYHKDKNFYVDWIKRHDALGFKPVMASGLWTWIRMWYDHKTSTETVTPCIEACRETALKELIFTMWGDDGGYCEFDSVFTGLAWAADYAFNKIHDESRTASLYAAVCGSDYHDQLIPSDIELPLKHEGKEIYVTAAAATLWDDPLMGIIWHEYRFFDADAWKIYSERLKSIRDRIAPLRNDTGAGNMDHAWNVVNTLVCKIDFREALVSAYRSGNRKALSEVKNSVRDVISAINGFNESYRRQWFRSYKSYGLEVMQIRLAGLRERFMETERRLGEYLDGKITSIAELELTPRTSGFNDTRYRMIATGGWFI